jgi:flagellar hook-length control protein FliK
MTQIASFDLGALAANRQQAPAQGASKARGDFMSAYNQAATEARKQARTQDADRAENKRAERDHDAAPTPEADEAPKAEQARAEKSERPEQVDHHNKQADEAPKAEKPKAEQKPAEAPTAEAPAQSVAETPVAEQPAETAPLDAQAVLALQLATGGQVAQPVVTAAVAANAEPEAVAQTQVVDATAQAGKQAQQAQVQTPVQAQAQPVDQADEAVQAAIAQAAKQANAEAKGHAAKAQASAHASEHANARAQAQSPAFLAEAAQNLGPITVEVSKQVQAEVAPTPVVAQPTEGDAESGNLAMQLIDLKMQKAAEGSTTPVTKLDGAEGTEMTSQLASLLSEDDEAGLTVVDGEKPTVQGVSGDRLATAETAKASAMAKEAPAPARAEDVLPQVSKHLEALKSNQANAIKLQLYPEHLGKMEIKVVSHQGVLSAQLTADSHTVKAMLETQVAALQRSFAEMGIKVDKVEVTLSSANLGQDAYAQGQGMQQGEQQQFGREQQTRSGSFNGSGYQQWLGDEPVDEAVYAQADASAAINYVA